MTAALTENGLRWVVLGECQSPTVLINRLVGLAFGFAGILPACVRGPAGYLCTLGRRQARHSGLGSEYRQAVVVVANPRGKVGNLASVFHFSIRRDIDAKVEGSMDLLDGSAFPWARPAAILALRRWQTLTTELCPPFSWERSAPSYPLVPELLACSGVSMRA